MFDFEKLETYRKAKAFNRRIIQFVWKNNACDPIVRNQLRRAALSILLNIAEGSGRFSAAEKRRFYIIARASAWETAAILDFIAEEQLMEEDKRLSLLQDCEEISKMLFGMIQQMAKQSACGKT